MSSGKIFVSRSISCNRRIGTVDNRWWTVSCRGIGPVCSCCSKSLSPNRELIPCNILWTMNEAWNTSHRLSFRSHKKGQITLSRIRWLESTHPVGILLLPQVICWTHSPITPRPQITSSPSKLSQSRTLQSVYLPHQWLGIPLVTPSLLPLLPTLVNNLIRMFATWISFM